MKWWFFRTLWHSPAFCSDYFWFTSRGASPSHPFTMPYHFPLRWHGSIWRHVPKTAATCPKVRLWKPRKRIKCKRSCPSSLHKKKTGTNSKSYIDWKRSLEIYVMRKVEKILSSSKSKLGIFPILEAHTDFVDSHWNRWHVQRRCLGALNPPSNRWERCSIHRSTLFSYCFVLYYINLSTYILPSLFLICLSPLFCHSVASLLSHFEWTSFKMTSISR